jgi:hypothetical protein
MIQEWFTTKRCSSIYGGLMPLKNKKALSKIMVDFYIVTMVAT